MLKILFIFMTLPSLDTKHIGLSTDALATNNPLLEPWDTLYETPPFSLIKPHHFMEAIPMLIAEVEVEIMDIIENNSIASFENSVEALEYSGIKLSRALSIFHNLLGSNTCKELQAISLKLSPILTKYSNDITLNEALFKRIKSVYNTLADLSLSAEQTMLLENSYNDFVRSGANLNHSDKQIYRSISEELSTLSLEFDQNELAATNDFTIEISDVTLLAGLPSWALEGASNSAQAVNKEGYLITLHAPSYIAVMTYCENRALREELWRAYNSKCFGKDKNNNEQIVKRIVTLRHTKVNLLGYETYADYALQNRMAQSKAKVMTLLDELYVCSIDKARGEVLDIEIYAQSEGFTGRLQSWDFGFWAERYRLEYYDISDDMTRPYFELSNCEGALFMLAKELYGLTFKLNKEIEAPHTDAVSYEVFDVDGSFLSILYMDYHPRASKNSGAWMSTYRDMYTTVHGQEIRPIVTLVCNFTPATQHAPSLLSFNEFTTLLHEFGHALHGILAKGMYGSLTGTSVYRDFVELPSQIMENWAYEKAFLDKFAVHYDSGEKIPLNLISKIIVAKNFNVAYSNVRQLSFATADMLWHTITSPITDSVEVFEKEAMSRFSLLPIQEGVCMATSFGHIFAGGYAAGYYSYKWAEVLEAEAYNQFKVNGIFDKMTAERFRILLERGGTEKPMSLYVQFAGSEPTIGPLIEKMGF